MKHKASILLLAALIIFSLLILPCAIIGINALIDRSSVSHPLFADFEKVSVPDSITVYRTASASCAVVPFEDYVKGVVAGEMPSSFEVDALKAQAVAARTYSLSKVLRSGEDGNPAAHPEAPLCDDVHCQVYRSPEELTELKGEAWMADGWLKISKAVDDTAAQLMYYDGELAHQALFHSSTNGKTENSEDVFASAIPYLRSVDSPFEEEASHRSDTYTFTYGELTKKLNAAYPKTPTSNVNSGSVYIVSKNEGGSVKEINIGVQSYTGRQLREALSMYSAAFDVSCGADTVTFAGSGYGHGVGMSQYGANGMAKAGYRYKEILQHYYTGVQVL